MKNPQEVVESHYETAASALDRGSTAFAFLVLAGCALRLLAEIAISLSRIAHEVRLIGLSHEGRQ